MRPDRSRPRRRARPFDALARTSLSSARSPSCAPPGESPIRRLALSALLACALASSPAAQEAPLDARSLPEWFGAPGLPGVLHAYAADIDAYVAPTAVPEPATVSLVALGLALAGVAARRRRAAV